MAGVGRRQAASRSGWVYGPLDDPVARRRIGDLVYLLAGIASASMVAAANYYLVEPVTLSLLYAIPVGMVAYRFHYLGAAASAVVAAGLALSSSSSRPGSLFFDVLVLCIAVVALAGMISARLGSDRSMAEANAPEDPTTGFPSRRAMVGALSVELTRCARYGRPLSVLLVGVDGAEKVGPTALAKRLKEIGRRVEGGIRDVDVAGCYRRGEMMVVLPETRKTDAWAAAERLRVSIEQSRIAPMASGVASALTASVGVAGYPEDSLSVEGLLELAEDALFEAQTLGGNRARQSRKLQVVASRKS